MNDRISCMVITSVSRIHMLSEAVADFHCQTWPSKELVVVHDGSRVDHDEIRRVCGTNAVVTQVAPGLCLGGLRNHAVAAASGRFVCFWDDDDLYHPHRLAAQHDALCGDAFAASALRSQYYLFTDSFELFIRKCGPIHGTLLFRNGIGLRFENIARGEDSRFFKAFSKVQNIAVIDTPELYVRRFHGGNTWDRNFHRARLGREAYSRLELIERRPLIEETLSRYKISGVKICDRLGQTVFAN